MKRKGLTGSQLSRLLVAGLLASGYTECLAQGVTLDLSSAAGKPGYGIILSLTFSRVSGDAPASIQWTVGYSQLDFTAISVSAGPAAGDKVVSCSQTGGQVKCLLWGDNSTSIANGIVADVSLTISSSTQDTSSQVQIQGGQAADAQGYSVPISMSGGTVTILHGGPGVASSHSGIGSSLEAAARIIRPTPARWAGEAMGRTRERLPESSRIALRLDAKSFRASVIRQSLLIANGAVTNNSQVRVDEDWVLPPMHSIPDDGRLSCRRAEPASRKSQAIRVHRFKPHGLWGRDSGTFLVNSPTSRLALACNVRFERI